MDSLIHVAFCWCGPSRCSVALELTMAAALPRLQLRRVPAAVAAMAVWIQQLPDCG